MSEKNIVKNQHYVPCCVLVYFKESDIISRKKEPRLYHFLNKKREIYATTIDCAMSDKNFYEHHNLSCNYLENLIKGFEGKYATMQKNIVNLIEECKKNNRLLFDVRKLIFINLPNFLIMKFRSGAIFFELEYAHKNNAPLRIFEKLFMKERYIKTFAKIIIKFYDFCILESHNADFLISDRFISTASFSFKGWFMDITNRSIGLNNTLILIPISKSYYICFWNATKKKKPPFLNNDKINKLSEQQTIEINKGKSEN